MWMPQILMTARKGEDCDFIVPSDILFIGGKKDNNGWGWDGLAMHYC